MKCANVRIIGIPEGVEKNRGLEEQIVAENFPNLARETNICVQKAERTPPQAQPRQTYATSCHSAMHNY